METIDVVFDFAETDGYIFAKKAIFIHIAQLFQKHKLI